MKIAPFIKRIGSIWFFITFFRQVIKLFPRTFIIIAHIFRFSNINFIIIERNLTARRKNRLKKQTFLKGSLILIISAAIAKVMGALFKIPLTNLLGGVGMGYFSCAYGLFLPIYALSITGLSTAIAKVTAQEIAYGHVCTVRKIRRVSRCFFALLGFFLTFIIWVTAKPFASYAAADPDAYFSILAIAPSAFFGCITAVERGYYEGMQNMYPTAVSQAVESIAKLLFGLFFSQFVIEHETEVLAYFPTGTQILPIASAAGVLGVTISTVVGWLYLFLRNFASDGIRKSKLKSDTHVTSTKSILCELLKIMIPVALGSIVTNLTSLIDLCTMMRCLGNVQSRASMDLIRNFGEIASDSAFPAFVYGSFTGMALTVFNLVPSVTNMFGKSALPCAAQAWTKGKKNIVASQTRSVLFATSFFAIPSGFGLFFLSKPVMGFLYSGHLQEMEIASEALKALVPGMIFLCLTVPLFSILQGIGKADLPVKFMIVGVIVKLIGNIVLLNIPSICVSGAGISTSLCYGLIFVLCLYSLKNAFGESIGLLKLLLPIIYASAMCTTTAILCMSLFKFIPERLLLCISVLAAILMYTLVLWLLEKKNTSLKDLFCIRV